MAEENLDKSNDNGDVSDDTNDKSNDAGIGDTSNTNQNNKADEKKYSDKDYNDFVKRKTAELSTKLEEKHKKSLEGKHILTEDDLSKMRETWKSEYDKEIALNNKRADYKAKGLTDAQLDAVSVDNIEDYDKRVNELFGAILKKEAPVLNGGTKEKDNNQPENADINAWLQQDLEKTRYKR